MSESQFMATAGKHLLSIAQGIREADLGASTPCTEFDVRALVNHLLFWAPSWAGSGRKTTVMPPAESEADVDLTTDDWADDLERHVHDTVEAWNHPRAWDGLTTMGSPQEMPAPLIGGMVISELVVHGWDLARSTDQEPSWDDGLLEYVYAELSKTADLGREMGLYGPEVRPPQPATALDRVVAITGRDPAWRYE